MSSATPTTTATANSAPPPSTVLCPIKRQHLEIKAKIAQLAKQHSTLTTTSTVSKPKTETPIPLSTSQPASSAVKPITTTPDVIPKMQQPRRTRDGYTALVKLLY